MPFTWESLYTFFSPLEPRSTSPSLLSSAFKSTETTKQTDLPMPPSSAIKAAAGAPMPSPAESSASSLAASERDYFPPASAYTTHRSPSMSSTSTASTVPSDLQQQLLQGPQRTFTTPATTTTNPASQVQTDDATSRPAPPRRSATEIVAPEPMSRAFPKPEHEPTLDELLARKPGKWSLGHYVKNARERRQKPAVGETEAQERARKFEETKRALRRAKEEIESRAGKP